jgi:hypothetical protein
MLTTAEFIPGTSKLEFRHDSYQKNDIIGKSTVSGNAETLFAVLNVGIAT